MSDLTWAGVMTTASNVLFSGSGEGYFFALDARTGNLLWKTQLGSVVRSGPMSYAVNGKQHVAIAAGSALFVYKLRVVSTRGRGNSNAETQTGVDSDGYVAARNGVNTDLIAWS